MYEQFYQLTTNPFRLAPDPNFCFSHSGYQRAREYLEYAIDQGEGFVMVTGRPGTGKTLLLEKFLTELDASNVVARRIAVSNYSGDDLLRAVAYAYDIEAAELDKATLRHRIHHYFVQQEQAGRRVLLIIDEAQALQHTALEELRILADLQTQSRLMLQLFLVGQESLQELLRAPDMEQFQQRVIANYHLAPLNLVETRAYIEYRLLHAGWSGDPEFSSTAVLAIYQLSKGVPRHINKICNRLLLLGFGKGSYLFDKEDVQAISAEMGAEQLTPITSDQPLFAEADSITNIPEIRDGQVSLADLAIRIDKVDAEALAIAEASRLEVTRKKEFEARHHHDPETWNLPQSQLQPEPEPADAGAAAEPAVLQVPPPPEPEAVLPEASGTPAAERYLDRLKWRETLIATAALLAITTISIAALPSIFRGDDDRNATVQTTIQHPDVQLASGSVNQSGDKEEAGQAVVAPAVFEETAADEAGWSALPDLQEDAVQIAITEVADLPEMAPAPVTEAGISGSAETLDTRSTAGQPQFVDAGATELYSNDETGYQPAAGMIDRQSPAETLPGFVGPLYMASAAEQAGPADAIPELLAQGQRSLSDYRLMTPEGDNAYAYFREVLQQDPGNEEALAGIQGIVDIYVTLIQKEVDKDSKNRAYRYLGRALGIQPENPELLALKADLDQSVAHASIASAAPATRPVPASQGTVTKGMRSTADSLLQGIKTFFRKRQADARRGVVHVPSGWDG